MKKKKKKKKKKEERVPININCNPILLHVWWYLVRLYDVHFFKPTYQLDDRSYYCNTEITNRVVIKITKGLQNLNNVLYPS
jgi:hypothetical protein